MDKLNSKQREAVSATEGAVLVIAGAGAGKTKTVTERILGLIKKGVEPNSILAITFTNKAAAEIAQRVEKLIKNSLSYENDKPFIGTFHSLGVKIIRENSRVLNLPKHFTIFDREDSKKALKETMKESGIDRDRFDPSLLLQLISKKKGQLETPEDLAISLEGKEGASYIPGVLYKVWQGYEKILEREKALDFDDLLLKSVSLLRQKGILEHYQNLWRYIHIDEYQDTNKAQYTMANLLAEKHKNICVVGDSDQCIYSWRGAQFRNIIDFERDYREAKVIVLEENYRSTQNILKAANDIIKKNKLRIEKVLYTKKEDGDKLTLIENLDESSEAQAIALKVEELIKKGVSPNQVALLYRANFQSRALEEAFLTSGIPYQVVGTKFFERKEIKDIISFIRLALNPQSLTDLKRIINVPPRGIGKTTLLKIVVGKEKEIRSGIREKVISFNALMTKIGEQALKLPPARLVAYIIKESGLKKSLENSGFDERERLENIMELINVAQKYGDLDPAEAIEKFLADIALATDQDSIKDKVEAVKLMTVHASKGLEFDYCFITGLEEDLFPYAKPEMGEEEKEEERRLFYVALTRARKKIFLSYALSRAIFGSRQYSNPSPFISDIAPELIETDSPYNNRVGIINIDF